jgi:hypothetical protein
VDGLVVHGLAVWPAAGEFGEIWQKRPEDAARSGCYTVRSPHVVRAWNTNGHKVSLKRATSMGLCEVNIFCIMSNAPPYPSKELVTTPMSH